MDNARSLQGSMLFFSEIIPQTEQKRNQNRKKKKAFFSFFILFRIVYSSQRYLLAIPGLFIDSHSRLCYVPTVLPGKVATLSVLLLLLSLWEHISKTTQDRQTVYSLIQKQKKEPSLDPEGKNNLKCIDCLQSTKLVHGNIPKNEERSKGKQEESFCFYQTRCLNYKEDEHLK